MGTRQVGLRDVQQTAKPHRLRLLAPLRYLIIQAPEKSFYDVKLPIVVGVAAWVGYNLLEPSPPFLGPDGVLSVAQGFLIMAVPFLIGALAAVAMGSPGAHLDRRAGGVGIVLQGEILTLRQFVCYLLGYLCFLGLVTFIVVTITILIQPAVVGSLAAYPRVLGTLEQTGIAILLLLFAAFTITVFWALYFLTDIVNRHD